MRSHASYCFPMMRSNALNALVAMGQPPVDLSMGSRGRIGLPTGIADVRRRSTLCIRVRSQEGFELKRPL